MEEIFTSDDTATRAAGASLVGRVSRGDVVLLEGELGAGKTTFVRGVLEALGHDGPVRSPTFNLIQTFDTIPPVMHADLYRLSSADGLGLEDYMDSHLCLIEWPDRGTHLWHDPWVVSIEFTSGGRRIQISPPFKAG